MLTAPALLPVAPPLPSTPQLGQVIGQITASAAAAIARALREREHGRLDSKTTARAVDLVALLFSLQRATAGELDFYATARAQGVQALQQRWGKTVNARTIATLVDGVIEVLSRLESPRP